MSVHFFFESGFFQQKVVMHFLDLLFAVFLRLVDFLLHFSNLIGLSFDLLLELSNVLSELLNVLFVLFLLFQVLSLSLLQFSLGLVIEMVPFDGPVVPILVVP